jgi:hypothetical protein
MAALPSSAAPEKASSNISEILKLGGEWLLPATTSPRRGIEPRLSTPAAWGLVALAGRTRPCFDDFAREALLLALADRPPSVLKRR